MQIYWHFAGIPCKSFTGRQSNSHSQILLPKQSLRLRIPSTSSDDSSTDTSTSVICPLLNHKHIMELHKLRDELRYYFKTRNRLYQLKNKPWVFMVQLLKIVLMTSMLVLLTKNNNDVRVGMKEVKETLDTILIKGYDSYTEKDMLYKYQQIEDYATYACIQYLNLSVSTVTLIGYRNGMEPPFPPPVHITRVLVNLTISKDWMVSYRKDNKTKKTSKLLCSWRNHSCVLENKDKLSVNTNGLQLLSYTLKFKLRAVILNTASKVRCVNLTYEITFTNKLEQANGMHLDSTLNYEFYQDCQSDSSSAAKDANYYVSIMIDIAVMAISCISTVTMFRKLYVSYLLYKKTNEFMKVHYHRVLTRREAHLFFNYWHISIVITDILLILSGFFKLLIDLRIAFYFNTTTLLLGIGAWMCFMGLLRYLLFDRHYSMLINTITIALPHLGRFIICVAIVFLAFMLSGYLVLSPYCYKFTDPSVTMETLFSLLNGDDMFATFHAVETNNYWIKIFSKIYLYSYVCFFIYVVLSLCISIIEDAYSIVSNFPNDTCPWIRDGTVLQEFASVWERNADNKRDLSKGTASE